MRIITSPLLAAGLAAAMATTTLAQSGNSQIDTLAGVTMRLSFPDTSPPLTNVVIDLGLSTLTNTTASGSAAQGISAWEEDISTFNSATLYLDFQNIGTNSDVLYPVFGNVVSNFDGTSDLLVILDLTFDSSTNGTVAANDGQTNAAGTFEFLTPGVGPRDVTTMMLDGATGEVSTNQTTLTTLVSSEVTLQAQAKGSHPMHYLWTVGASTNAVQANPFAYTVKEGTTNILLTITNRFGTNHVAWTITGVTNQPPTITEQPMDVTVAQGDTAVFSVMAEDPDTPLSYQWWYYGASSSYTDITLAGETNASLTLTNVATTNAGHYYVEVSDSYEAHNYSSDALLTVLTPPPTNSYSDTNTYVPGQVAGLEPMSGSQYSVTWSKDGAGVMPAADNNYYLFGQDTLDTNRYMLAILGVSAGNVGIYTTDLSNLAGQQTNADRIVVNLADQYLKYGDAAVNTNGDDEVPVLLGVNGTETNLNVTLMLPPTNWANCTFVSGQDAFTNLTAVTNIYSINISGSFGSPLAAGVHQIGTLQIQGKVTNNVVFVIGVNGFVNEFDNIESLDSAVYWSTNGAAAFGTNDLLTLGIFNQEITIVNYGVFVADATEAGSSLVDSSAPSLLIATENLGSDSNGHPLDLVNRFGELNDGVPFIAVNNLPVSPTVTVPLQYFASDLKTKPTAMAFRFYMLPGPYPLPYRENYAQTTVQISGQDYPQLKFNTVQGFRYYVQYSDNPSGPWSTANPLSPIYGTGSLATWIDFGAGNASPRYYRVEIHQ